ncbi:DEAD/DEAH box helicase [Wenyingzhuangia sp. IMCC45574]
MKSFRELGAAPEYIKAMKEMGVKTPTEIQERSIPKLLENHIDYIGKAQTGTGKTIAFGLPLLQKLNPKKNEIQALVLAPTRELAQQIKKQLFKLTKYAPQKIFCEAIYGGEKIDVQIKNLERTTHVVVATPGRLCDLLDRAAIDISNIKMLVLDEADEMLSMGFLPDLNKILKYSTAPKNTWLFSATFPNALNGLIKTYMNNPVRVEVEAQKLMNENIAHKFISTTLNQKLDTLISFVESRGMEKGIVFCKTKLGAQKLKEELEEDGFSIAVLEGDMGQRDREKSLRSFKNGASQLLVCTDVAARGIDVPNVNYVIHYQLPENTEYFVHRSGRTARGGNKGLSVAIVLSKELEQLQALQKEFKIHFAKYTL